MISRSLCKETFQYDTAGGVHFPSWPCPECEHGRLQVSEKSLLLGSAKNVGAGIDGGYMEHWENYGVFVAMMYCQNRGCDLGVAVLGDFSTLTPDGIGYVIGQGIEGSIVRKHTITAIHPAPMLIDVPPQTPDFIAKAISKSFTLYWTDLQACAGSVQIAIEAIADHLRPRPNTRQGYPIPLGQHLAAIKTDQPQHANHAEAFQLIVEKLGNAGAHGDPVERDRLLDAYELLELELRKLFEGNRRSELIDRIKSP